MKWKGCESVFQFFLSIQPTVGKHAVQPHLQYNEVTLHWVTETKSGYGWCLRNEFKFMVRIIRID